MKAFVLTIGEKTTQMCCHQLKKFGFDIYLLDGKESMLEKYKRFILEASKQKEPVLKIDADVIVNKNILLVDYAGVSQYQVYDFYTNTLGYHGVMTYSQEILFMIKNQLKKLNTLRPESSACRLLDVNQFQYTYNMVVGLHGFFQFQDDIRRVREHTLARKHPFDDDFITNVDII